MHSGATQLLHTDPNDNTEPFHFQLTFSKSLTTLLAKTGRLEIQSVRLCIPAIFQKKKKSMLEIHMRDRRTRNAPMRV